MTLQQGTKITGWSKAFLFLHAVGTPSVVSLPAGANLQA